MRRDEEEIVGHRDWEKTAAAAAAAAVAAAAGWRAAIERQMATIASL